MERQRVDRGARAYYELAGSMTDHIRSGMYQAQNFTQRMERVCACIDEFAACDDDRLKEAAAIMVSILVALPSICDPRVDAQIATAAAEWSRIINEVIADGV